MQPRICLCILATVLLLPMDIAGIAAAQDATAEPRSAPEWYKLGGTLEKKGDLDAALAAYDKAFEVTGKSNNWLPVSATLAAASIQLRQLKTNDALKTLKRYNRDEIKDLSSVWQVRMLRALGRAYAAQGLETEAWAEFKKALAIESQS